MAQHEKQRADIYEQVLPSTQRLFVDTLLFSGARITEALELQYSMVDIDAGTLTFRTLKQGGRRVYKNRSVPGHIHDLNLPELAEVLGLDPQNENLEVILRQSVKQPILDKWRDVPVPGRYLERLDAVLEVRRCQIKCKSRDEKQQDQAVRLFTVGRTTASDWVKSAMNKAGIAGAQASAKGLRHTFGVNHALAGTPQAVLQQLMGHSNPNMTARYMKVVDAELREIVCKTWTRQ